MKDYLFYDQYHFYLGIDRINQHLDNNHASTLYVMCNGFDPRMCENILRLRNKLDHLSVLLLIIDEGFISFSDQYVDLAKKNRELLSSLNCTIRELNVMNNASMLSVLRESFNFSDLSKQYGRIIVDTSSMPQSIFINLISHMLKESGKNSSMEMSVVTCENSDLDDAITPTGLSDSAKLLIGFDTFSSSMDSDENPIPLLMPLLGKGSNDELERLFSSLSPAEICPVLPFPSKSPRRSDEILAIVGRTLFESFSVDINNIIYVAEQNVFDTYMKLTNAINHYHRVLSIIGTPKFYIAIGSSKLIALGALLACNKLRSNGVTVAFATVDNNGYKFEKEKYNPNNNLISYLCLNAGIHRK